MMNEVGRPASAEVVPDVGASSAQVTSNASRRLCEHGQSVAEAISEWNTEVSHFLSHRAARSGGAMQSFARCQSFVDIFAIQAQWLRDAVDDYLKQTSKMIELNNRFLNHFLESASQLEVPPSKDDGSLTVRAAPRAAS
jgi:hypothetical protein